MVLTFSSECHCRKCTGNLTDGKGPGAYFNISVVTRLVSFEVHPLKKVREGQTNSAGQILLTAVCSSLLFMLDMLQTTGSLRYYLIIIGCLYILDLTCCPIY